jgi:hypothetical protein
VGLGLGDGLGVLVGVVVGDVEPLVVVVAAELFEASFVPAAPQPVINEIASRAVKPLPSRVIRVKVLALQGKARVAVKDARLTRREGLIQSKTDS